MEALALLAVVFAAVWAMVAWLHQTWRFTWRGREVEVRNYSFRETVSIDGEEVPVDRDTDYLTYALLRAEVDGHVLEVRIDATTGGIGCVAREGTRVVYSSQRNWVIGVGDEVPDSAEPREPEGPTDVRWGPARVLLDEIANSDDAELVADGRVLRDSLRAALLDLDAARAASNAHTALGGEPDDTLVALAETRVGELVSTLRELHGVAARAALATSDPGPGDVKARLAARREVDELRRRAEAARVKQRGS